MLQYLHSFRSLAAPTLRHAEKAQTQPLKVQDSSNRDLIKRCSAHLVKPKCYHSSTNAMQEHLRVKHPGALQPQSDNTTARAQWVLSDCWYQSLRVVVFLFDSLHRLKLASWATNYSKKHGRVLSPSTPDVMIWRHFQQTLKPTIWTKRRFCLCNCVHMCYLGDRRRDICGCDTPEFDHSSGHKGGSYQDNTGTQGMMGNRV